MDLAHYGGGGGELKVLSFNNSIGFDMHGLSAKAWFDGACAGNPGPMGIGGLIILEGGEKHTISEQRGFGTNNVAEYTALIEVLKLAIELGVTDLQVKGDSQLVVNQVNGDWAVKNRGLVPYCDAAEVLMARIPRFKLQWVRREQNQEADRLSSSALKGGGKNGEAQGSRQRKNLSVAVRKVGDHIYVAEGSHGNQYAVDLKARTCSCPDWQRRQSPCKHMMAAERAHEVGHDS